jgi:signal transduction histidine kinase
MRVQRKQSQEELIRALQQQVDELTHANLLLQEELARKEQFTAMIAHELRGPLAPIISYAQMIARPNCRRETLERGTSIILGQALRLKRLVNDLLDASYLSTGQFKLMPAECDLVALIRELVEQLRPLAPYHELKVEAPDQPIVGRWDGVRLQQAVGNLLDNAIKYSDEHTTITVRVTQPTEELVRVSVHNVGRVIPAAEINQIFRPYVRLQAARGRQGTGLGLYITKNIVEAHGGTLRLERPSNEEQGTTFSFDLPLR